MRAFNEASQIRDQATDLLLRKKLSESHFNIINDYLFNRLEHLFWITKVILSTKDMTIFGFNFGNVAGVVLVDEQKSEIVQWNDTRIDIKHSDTINVESTITVIKNNGLEVSEKIKVVTFRKPLSPT